MWLRIGSGMARRGSEGDKGKGRSRGALGVGRFVSLLAFLPIASRAPLYVQLIAALVLDGRVPPARKAVLAGALGYLALGRDLIPDDVPVLGGLDDLVVVVLAVDAFLDGIPADLLDEKLDDLGIDRAEFERDIAQIRRLTPGPVRRTIRRVPHLVGAAGDAVQRSGLGPRLRAWITREESIA
jgi:uncharacterized membrane protein YkvA (DUF1232 family)